VGPFFEEFLPPDHSDALKSAVVMLYDEFSEDLAGLLGRPHRDFADTVMFEFLPNRYLFR
jgi:hypothetical protein